MTVSISPSSLRADVGSPAKFTCRVSGFPVRGVTWLRDGRQISPGKSAAAGDQSRVAFSRDKTVNAHIGQWNFELGFVIPSLVFRAR